MTRILPIAAAALVLWTSTTAAQAPDAKQVAQERAQAELDAPKLAEVLELGPDMTVADVGAGFGAMTIVLAKSRGAGRVFATDINERQLTVIRDSVEREGLTNVTVIEGAAASTNLPASCCEAILLRHVYHHITAVEAFNRSLHAALKPGGRVAIVDFVPEPGSELPKGVLKNRGGHGVPPDVLIPEIEAAGLVHVRTIEKWPPGEKAPGYLTLFKKPQ